jgi:hypothetical protein
MNMVRAAMILGGLLVASSALAGSDVYPQDSLEKFGSTGLPQMEVAVKPASHPAKVAVRVTKETRVAEGSLEKFGATGLGQ